MKITVEKDGSLSVYEQGPQQLDAKGTPMVDAAGAPIYTGRTRSIASGQIAAHRLDPVFETALQAAVGQAGNLSADELAKLPAAK